MSNSDKILETYEKEPGEITACEVSFVKYLASVGEVVGAAHTLDVTADSGITATGTLTAGVARLEIEGGADEQDYLVTAELSTAAGLLKFGRILIQVRETVKP